MSTKAKRLLWFAVLVLLVLALGFCVFVYGAREGQKSLDATQSIMQTWDAELHQALTAESGRK